jgi:hypothetical protein
MSDMLKQTKDIKVRTERQATRCEICHKADVFDAENNYCSRCNEVEKALALNQKLALNTEIPNQVLPQQINRIVSIVNIATLATITPILLACCMIFHAGVFPTTMVILFIAIALWPSISKIVRQHNKKSMSNNVDK